MFPERSVMDRLMVAASAVRKWIVVSFVIGFGVTDMLAVVGALYSVMSVPPDKRTPTPPLVPNHILSLLSIVID